jgi:hypothetical protein
MVANSEDCNRNDHITSSRDQLLANDQSDVGVSVNGIRRTPPSVEINQQIDTNDYANVAKERNFLICDSCLWCATCFKNRVTVPICPRCHKGKIDCMPIGEDKDYCFGYRIPEVLS